MRWTQQAAEQKSSLTLKQTAGSTLHVSGHTFKLKLTSKILMFVTKLKLL